MTGAQDTSHGPEVAKARSCAALGATIVAGAFCATVAAILAAHHFRTAAVHLSKSDELAGLRAELVRSHQPEARKVLQQRIAERDLALRQEFFGHQRFMRRGGYLLLVGATVLFVAAARTASLRRKVPLPSRGDARSAAFAAAAARVSRWSVAAVAVVMAAGGAALVATFSGPVTGVASPEARPDAAVPPPPPPEVIARQWPRFRGPGGLGIAACSIAPTAWNGKTGEGIAWKTPVPLPGENSPVVWNDRIFLSGASEEKREVYCFSAQDGQLVWRAEVTTPASSAAEPPDVLEDTGYAAPTLATDGRYVAAIFANGDVACFDPAGKRLWARNLGPFKNSYGYASSLCIYRDTVIVLVDQGTPGKPDSSILALDCATGRTVWQTPRPVPASWATPILYHTGTREELLTVAKPWVIAYDPSTGRELWKAKVLDGDVAPSPVYAAGMAFAANAGSKLAAIRVGGQGDVTESAIVWSAEDGLPDISSPLATGKIVLLVTTDGMLTCHNAADGKVLWQKELDTIIKSSPTLVGDKIYLMSEKGVMYIFAAGAEFKELGRAELGEESNCSPAFLDGRIYIRGKKHLFAIGTGGTAPDSPPPVGITRLP